MLIFKNTDIYCYIKMLLNLNVRLNSTIFRGKPLLHAIENILLSGKIINKNVTILA